MDSIDDGRDIQVGDVADIGRAVRSARKSQGLTQREFADVVGVGVRFLSELERGKATAEVGLVLRVLAGAGYDVRLQPRHWRGATALQEDTPPSTMGPEASS